MMLDGFAGFGGQSQAFLDAGWDILRLDNNPLLADVPRMAMVDLTEVEPFNLCNAPIEYVHMSPPCLEFSTAFDAPRARAFRAGVENYQPDLSLVRHSIRIIEALKPRFWSIENVKGSIRWLKPILGEPRLIVGSWVYWGNFPLFDPATLKIPTKASQDRRHSPLRANYRAHIPLSVSTAFLTAMTQQKTISDF
jgi:hypothetical protein